MRRVAERAPELTAEVSAREAGGARQVTDVERLEVPGVGQVLRAQEMTGGPGIAMRTIAMSGCPAGPTVSQRKSPSSGKVTSERTSMPSFWV